MGERFGWSLGDELNGWAEEEEGCGTVEALGGTEFFCFLSKELPCCLQKVYVHMHIIIIRAT